MDLVWKDKNNSMRSIRKENPTHGYIFKIYLKKNSISAIIGNLLLTALKRRGDGSQWPKKSSSIVLPHRVGKDERMPVTIDR